MIFAKVNLGYLVNLPSGRALEKAKLDDAGQFPVFGSNGEIGRSNQLNVTKKSIIIGRVGACGEINITPDRAFVTDNALIVEPRQNLVLAWLKYALLDANLGRYKSGTAQPLITASGISRIPIPLPPLDEQRKIADYLDRETGQIDRMVEQLDTLVEELRARRSAVISNILDFLPLRVSIGTVVKSIASGTTPASEWMATDDREPSVPWVTTGELRENTIHGTRKMVKRSAIDRIPGLTLHPSGSLVIAMYGATIGRLGFLGSPATTNQACCVFSKPVGLYLRFLFWVLLNNRISLALHASGGGQPNINAGLLRRWRIPLPPLGEQHRIADYLDNETAKIDIMIDKATTLQEELTARRSALITEVVTGRKRID